MSGSGQGGLWRRCLLTSALKVSWDSGKVGGTRLERLKRTGTGAAGWREDSSPGGEGGICHSMSSREQALEKGGSGTSSRVSPCPLQSALFPSPFQNDINASLLNNYVLGAQLGREHVKNLSEPINISFWHNQSLVL